MYTAVLPLPAVCVTRGPPLTCGPANGAAADGPGAAVGSRIAADGSSKYSRQLLVESATRPFHLSDRRLAAATSKPMNRWWYPGRLVSTVPPPGGTADACSA